MIHTHIHSLKIQNFQTDSRLNTTHLATSTISCNRMVPPKFIKSEAISSKMAIEKKATSTTFANPNNKKLRPRIPATDPKQIQNLWFQVRKQKFRNMTSIPKYLKPTEASARRSKDPNATASSSSVTPSGVGSTPPTSKSSTIAIKDPNFRELFLTPRGISIDDVTCTTSDPFIHFHTVRPSSYKGLEGLGRTTLWLDAEPTFLEEVTKGYFFMNYHNFCEAEYASFAKENLLKREPWEFILDNNKDSSQRFPRAERMLEFVCKPNGFFWQAPPPPPHLPVNSSENRTYSFDIRPDCSYWISRHAFNSKYSGQMGALVHVSQARITCPYFTVEFKRDDVDDRVAKNQVAAFGALALYNRYLLRYAAFPQNWTHEQECQLRHYALTITKSSYTFWCIRPKLKGRVWTGCHMEKIFVGYLDELQGVTDFVSWINEIHRWGLTNYLASCGKDIRLRAEAQGHRTSLDVQEMECTCLHLPDAAGTSEQETRNPTQALAGTSKIQGPALNNGAASVDPAKTAAEVCILSSRRLKSNVDIDD